MLAEVEVAVEADQNLVAAVMLELAAKSEECQVEVEAEVGQDRDHRGQEAGSRGQDQDLVQGQGRDPNLEVGNQDLAQEAEVVQEVEAEVGVKVVQAADRLRDRRQDPNQDQGLNQDPNQVHDRNQALNQDLYLRRVLTINYVMIVMTTCYLNKKRNPNPM